LREDREQNENSLRVMYRQSGQGQVQLQPNSVGIDDRASGAVNSSQRWYGELGRRNVEPGYAMVDEGGLAMVWQEFDWSKFGLPFHTLNNAEKTRNYSRLMLEF
jgi:hypothetical protein